MYVLNLLFDLKDRNGLFCGDDTTVMPRVLGKSKNWLDLRLNGQPEPIDPYRPPEDPTAPPPPFDPEVVAWEDLKEIGTLLIPQKYQPQPPPPPPPPPPVPDPDWICIRAVQHTQNQPFLADKLQIVVSFGRPVRARQKLASPFTDVDGQVLTTFASPLQGKNTSRGWWFPLGRIALRPDHRKLTHRYEFSVGLIVTGLNPVTHLVQEFHYGEDPEMDIEM